MCKEGVDVNLYCDHFITVLTTPTISLDGKSEPTPTEEDQSEPSPADEDQSEPPPADENQSESTATGKDQTQPIPFPDDLMSLVEKE